MTAANAAAVNTNSAPIQTSSANAVNSSQSLTTSVAMSAPASNNAMSSKQQSRAKRSRENAKLRPLNSFIAFRSKFQLDFGKVTQLTFPRLLLCSISRSLAKDQIWFATSALEI